MPEYVTPLMQQFADLKEKYTDCLVLFRLGDFYELFDEDAKIGAAILDITLTRKSQSKGGDIPMAGVPYHALDSYLYKLVSAGHKVAIAEQVGEVTKGPGLVERKVVRIVTPGTLLEEGSLETKQNSYVMTLTQRQVSETETQIAFALADITTGQLITAQEKCQTPETYLSDIFTMYQPKECVLPDELYNNPKFLETLQRIAPDLNVSPYSAWKQYADTAAKHIRQHFSVKSLKGFDLENKPLAQEVVATLLGYLEYTQQDPVKHIRGIVLHQPQNWVSLDRATITNLELLTTLRDNQKRGSLLHHLDHTQTSMGGRLLRQWLIHPLRRKTDIETRQNVVTFFAEHPKHLTKLQSVLSEVGDIERLLSRLSVGIGNARDMGRLQQSLAQSLEVKKVLDTLSSYDWSRFLPAFTTDLQTLNNTIANTLLDEPGFDPRQGGIIRAGVSAELDELRAQVEHSQDWMLALEKTEREQTGITNLKIRSNKVFGFYIEVSKSHLTKIPEHYERKQTLVNSERFFTAELKEKEVALFAAEEKSKLIEHEIYLGLVTQVLEHTDALQTLSQVIAELDCLAALAEVALQHRYVAPTLTECRESDAISISAGRHPVVETLLNDTPFVPNDTQLDPDHQLHILTGPNMAGKSVYIRQVALITLLAHIGSHVPAEQASISLVDKIFVRSGASDIITAGLSTFMVEMVETAYILRNATPHSLIIMDEIGRGTSTYDGISIAQSVAEYIATQPDFQAKTLFATHYHELQELAKQHANIHNFQVAVDEHEDEPVFLHRVLPGGADHSFGVAVAKLAGLPEEVTQKAEKRLQELESDRSGAEHAGSSSENALQSDTLTAKLSRLNIGQLTPLEALNILAEWQKDL
ncbi:DNA mismatch repair protein MutS [Candidatus Woesebacteria bacterium]|nr:DNA mismatch repair protein MutS [Candidatus Woesebacteria bacterium]MCD8527030.1 DNA mismatch repair protein MutS [Candidatus Woesebacteria bacterium]MCD8545907.1 DNA mismatch repair protein MutS [Candidatus Woesebacteria bacterium]